MHIHPARRTIILTVALAALGGAAGAGAAGSFDGVYRGPQHATLVNNTGQCQSIDRPNTMLVIKDNHFTRQWGPAELSVDVAPDGTFDQKQITNDSRKLRAIEIKGRITGNNLEADIGSDLCAAHLSLTKS